MYCCYIVKQAVCVQVDHVRIRSWNMPVLRNECKEYCSMKQQEPLMSLELTNDRLRVRGALPTAPRYSVLCRKKVQCEHVNTIFLFCRCLFNLV